jgi:hypothetical protein
MFKIALTIWLTANPLLYDTVYASPMPFEVCQAVANKLNLPLLFPQQFSGRAVCVDARVTFDKTPMKDWR